LAEEQTEDSEAVELLVVPNLVLAGQKLGSPLFLMGQSQALMNYHLT
jgi:hypothetical protein